MDGGQWTPASRNQYNLRDAVARCTTQVSFNAFFILSNSEKTQKFKLNSINMMACLFLVRVQVYPKSWTAIYLALDNVGMWNVRSEFWARQYLGQQFYLRVYTASTSLRDEYPIPKNALLCGKAAGRHTRPL